MTHLGELVKQEMDKRNCGRGYNPKTETYTSWYNILKFKVKYEQELDERDSTGYLMYRTMHIQKRSPLQTAATLYHEIQHADMLPANLASIIAVQLGFYWYFVSELGTGLIPLSASALASFSIAKIFDKAVLDKIGEFYADYRTSKKFEGIT